MDTEKAEAAFAGLRAHRHTFFEMVRQLHEAGVRSYQVDFAGSQTVLYGGGGGRHVMALDQVPPVVGQGFSAAAIDRVIAEMRGPNPNYADFLRQMSEAGVAQYFVYLRGRRAVYLGVDGDQHVVHLPART